MVGGYGYVITLEYVVSERVRPANDPYSLMRCHFTMFSFEMNHSSFRSMRFHPSRKR